MELSKLGEDGLINRIISRHLRKDKKSNSVLIDAGDDAAVINRIAGNIVITTDLLIENVHFKVSWADKLGGLNNLFYNLGYKSAAVNISDLSAMGTVTPLYCIIGLGIPSKYSVSNIDNLYSGLRNAFNRCGIRIIGGDTNSSEKLVISITLLGKCADKYGMIPRSGAKPGNKIYVSGRLGNSAAGLHVLMNNPGIAKLSNVDKKWFINKHFHPPIRLTEAKKIARHSTAMIDCSDGLIKSIRIICEQSHCAAKVYLDKVPVSDKLKKLPGYIRYIVNSGEDYELIFTSSSQKLDKIIPGIKYIGEITTGAKNDIKYYLKDRLYKIPQAGYEHFK